MTSTFTLPSYLESPDRGFQVNAMKPPKVASWNPISLNDSRHICPKPYRWI
ncbi:hypothetical protein DK68_3102 [Brucella suis]|nr:hypothetical protein DK68_3102 [Brucella suis]